MGFRRFLSFLSTSATIPARQCPKKEQPDERTPSPRNFRRIAEHHHGRLLSRRACGVPGTRPACRAIGFGLDRPLRLRHNRAASHPSQLKVLHAIWVNTSYPDPACGTTGSPAWRAAPEALASLASVPHWRPRKRRSTGARSTSPSPISWYERAVRSNQAPLQRSRRRRASHPSQHRRLRPPSRQVGCR